LGRRARNAPATLIALAIISIAPAIGATPAS
jgi:hypothetical protein